MANGEYSNSQRVKTSGRGRYNIRLIKAARSFSDSSLFFKLAIVLPHLHYFCSQFIQNNTLLSIRNIN